MSLPNGENRNNQENRKPAQTTPPAGKSYSQSTYRYYTGGISGMPVNRQGDALGGKMSKNRRKVRWPVLISVCICVIALITGAVILIRNLPSGGHNPSSDIPLNTSTAISVSTPLPTPGEVVGETEKKKIVASYTDRYAPNICIDGVEIGGLTRQEAEEKISQIDYEENAKSGWQLELVYGNQRYEVEDDLYGTKVDYASRDLALEYAFSIGKEDEQRGKTWEYAYDELIDNSDRGYSFDTPVTIVSVGLDNWLEGIAKAVYRAPVNAFVSEFNPQNYKSPFKVVDDIPGVRLNVEKVKQDILNYAEAGWSGTYELTTEPVQADFTTADAWNSVAPLSQWTTTISTSSSDDRTDNIKEAMRRINGTILNDGDVFSFNGTVKRTLSNGFKPAPAYVNGDIVTQVGGGVCQASSTMYVAALRANLNIVERQQHSMTVNYTDLGKDATVNSEGKVIDMKFRNNTGGTIYVCTGVEKRTVYCYIYGPAMEKGVSYDVDAIEVETVIGADLEPVYKKDKEGLYITYTDEEPYLFKNAVDGHVVDAYLVKYMNGVEVERTRISHDVFAAQAAVYYVGIEKPPVFPEDEVTGLQ